jgi:hypothetical protein
MIFDRLDAGGKAMDIRGKKRSPRAVSKRFSCTQCSRVFTIREYLERHQIVHQSNRQHPCLKCEKLFYRRDIWIRHLSRCLKSRRTEQHSSLSAVTAIRDPFVVSGIHQSFSTPGLLTNDLTRTNSTSKASEIFSLQNDGTGYDKDDQNQSESGVDTYSTPCGSPVPHTTTVGGSQWMGHLSRIRDDSDTAEILSSSSGANVNKPGFPTVPGLYECNNLDTIDQLNLLASRTVEATEPLHLEESSAIADSSKHEGYTTNVAENPVEMDELKRGSIQVREVQRNHLQDALQEFLAFFGDKLIQTAESKGWMENTLLHSSVGSVRNTKEMFSMLLENYAAEMMFLHCCFKHPPIDVGEESNSSQKGSWTFMDDTLELIHHYRADIADYFCYNSIEGLEIAAFTEDSPLEVTQQRIVLRWYSSFEESKSSQKGLQHIGNVIHKRIGTAGEGIISNEFDLVKKTLVSDEVFHRLASELRQLEPYHWENTIDITIHTRSQIVTSEFGLPDGVNTQEFRVTFKIEWDILDFMRSQYGELVPIATVVVLTGSSTNAQATTCGEYVRKNWPLVGLDVLKIIDKSLTSESEDYARVDPGSSPIQYIVANPDLQSYPDFTFERSPQFRIKTNDQRTQLCVEGASSNLITAMTQLFAWIGSALNTSRFGDELLHAKAILKSPSKRSLQLLQEFGSPPSIELELRFKHTPLHATEIACWLPLFKGATIASGFPIPDRAEEVGLEIPLELLARLADVRQAIEFEGGIVLKGFGEMFVPVKKTGDRVQWHAIVSEDSENRLTFDEGLSLCKSRALLDEVSFEDLKSTRAIVGWCCAATTRLGSDVANYENIDYSGAKEAGSVLRCAGGQIGLQQIGTGILDFKLGAKDGNFHVPRLGRYQKIVSAAERTPIVLYGTKEQRSWLVFASDVLLHIIQHRHRLDPFKVKGKTVKLDTTVTPGSSAKTVLLRHEKSLISDEQDYTFKDLVVDIWTTLESLVDQNTRRAQNLSGTPVKASLRESFRGYEYNAVVEDRSPFILKEQELSKTSGGWPLLVRDINALVLFADGFGEVIIPAESAKNSLCRMWHGMPSNMDYMATTSRVLKDLYDVAGCRITRKYLTSTQLRWHRGESLVFEACKDTLACRCNRLQQIIPKASIGSLVPPGLLEDEGAVIFGQSGSLLQGLFSISCQKPVQITGIYSQPNIPLRSLDLHHSIEDTLSSENSSRTGSNGTAESVSTSLSSSCSALPVQTMLSEIPEMDEIAKPLASSKRRLCLADSPFEISDKDAEHYEAFERLRELRAGKRRQCVNAESSRSHS